MLASQLAQVLTLLLIAGLALSGKKQTISDAGRIETQHLTQALYCQNQVVEEEHRYHQLPVRSRVECAMLCREDDRCVSVLYDRDRYLCQLADSKAFENCSNMQSLGQSEHSVVFFQQPPVCAEGETLGPVGLCICAHGFAGTPCSRYFHDCNDMYHHGDWQGDGIYTVQPLNFPQAFKVYCRHITNSRLYVMQRKKKNRREKFDRPWADYKDGFGDLKTDFWIGLEKLHALTMADRSYRLRMNIKLHNGTIIVHTYHDFKVTNETTGYRLFFNTSFLNGPDDCFKPLFDAPFSTYDHDQDGQDDVNCAQLRKGGFWFNGSGCSTCNPHGVISSSSNGLLTGIAGEAFWAFLGDVAPFKLSMSLVPAEGESHD